MISRNITKSINIWHQFLYQQNSSQKLPWLKVAFFSESVIRFSNLQISKKKKKIQKIILSLKSKFPANDTLLLLVGNISFKLRIVVWNTFFWDLEV